MSISHARYPQLDKDAIEDFIKQFSVAVRYWKAIQCPCFTPESGQPNLACFECRGLGWFYGAPECESKYHRAVVHSRRSQRVSEKAGLLTTGYASVTLQSGVIPGDGDLIQVTKDQEVVNDEYHTRGAQLTDGSTAETLRFRDVLCVERVLVWDATAKRVSVLPPDEWSFNAQARTMAFTKLQIGTKYSVRYIARPEYIVMGQTAKPLLRVSHNDTLPEPARILKDVVYPYNVQAVRLDRAILSRQRGQADLDTASTFNNEKGRGPFR